MRSWIQLESDFRSLANPGLDVRLDHQSGAAGEHWNVTGGASPQSRAKFEALARMAGEKLMGVPTAAAWSGVAEEGDPVIRWYRALRQVPGSYCGQDFYAIQKDDEGNDAGVIYFGSINNVYETSAAMCATLESLATSPRRRAQMLCLVPRYAGPCQHWRSAQSALDGAEPDFAKAAHEAVSAVEGLCRIILGDSSVTLGEALKRMKQEGSVHPALVKSISGLWGYTSDEPGIRHGASTTPSVAGRDARYVVEACEAALAMLLALDGERA